MHSLDSDLSNKIKVLEIHPGNTELELSFAYFRYKADVQKLKCFQINKVKDNMDNILATMDLILTLPPTSVFNERIFSQMKAVKTEQRNGLNQDALNYIMFIKLECDDIADFDPEPGIQNWARDCKRGRQIFKHRTVMSSARLTIDQDDSGEEPNPDLINLLLSRKILKTLIMRNQFSLMKVFLKMNLMKRNVLRW